MLSKIIAIINKINAIEASLDGRGEKKGSKPVTPPAPAAQQVGVSPEGYPTPKFFFPETGKKFDESMRPVMAEWRRKKEELEGMEGEYKKYAYRCSPEEFPGATLLEREIARKVWLAERQRVEGEEFLVRLQGLRNSANHETLNWCFAKPIEESLRDAEWQEVIEKGSVVYTTTKTLSNHRSHRDIVSYRGGYYLVGRTQPALTKKTGKKVVVYRDYHSPIPSERDEVLPTGEYGDWTLGFVTDSLAQMNLDELKFLEAEQKAS